MSRTHLYRATGPARPLASVVLAALWCGSAVGALLATAPLFPGGVPLNGPAAAMLERTFAIEASAGIIVALATIGAELVGGRTVARAARLAGAGALLIACVAGVLDTSRRLLRPGTPANVSAATRRRRRRRPRCQPQTPRSRGSG